MPHMVRFSIPIDEGNDLVKSGKIGRNFQSLMEDFKPEAAYFYSENGQRSGFMIFDIADSSDMVKVVESFWFGLHADVSVTPVVSGEDLAKGLVGISGIVKRYS